VLLHGFPTTSWHYRLVIPMFAAAGYRVIVPDYRGAVNSSRPRMDHGVPADLRGEVKLRRGGYSKWEMAEDMHELLHDHLGLTDPVFILGSDVGSFLSVSYALRYRAGTRALGYGEGPQPGTSMYERIKRSPTEWHWAWLEIMDLPEAMIAGKEGHYLQHFYDRFAGRPTRVDTQAYARAYAQPGALRAGFDLYRNFEQDAEDYRAALARDGKLTIPCLGISGVISLSNNSMTEDMGREFAENVTVAGINCGHWIAEEAPEELVDAVLRFDGKAPLVSAERTGARAQGLTSLCG
jgi:pimeloyl-ACP methyl ester carboxylesterase